MDHPWIIRYNTLYSAVDTSIQGTQPRRQGAFPCHLQRQGKAPWGRGCPLNRSSSVVAYLSYNAWYMLRFLTR